MRTWRCRLEGEEATRALGEQLGRLATDGVVVALDGDLGAGKTCLSQGVGRGLGVAGPVTSPTFQLLFVYEDGRLPLHHADLYRLGDDSELQELGFDEILGAVGVSLVEWASRFPQVLPADHLALQLDFDGAEARVLRARALGPLSERLLSELARRWEGRRAS